MMRYHFLKYQQNMCLCSENYTLLKEEFYEAMFKEADMDGEIELIADSHFVVVE